jgi:hypothetical protein
MASIPPLASLAAFVIMAGGHNPTDNSSVDLSAHRAHWAARGLTKYAYEYKLTGFNVSWANRQIHIVVLNGVVASATDVAAGQPAPGDPASWPTIDKLFDQASQASTNRTLRTIRFDPTFDYPTEIDLAGPPDASGSIVASGLSLLP